MPFENCLPLSLESLLTTIVKISHQANMPIRLFLFIRCSHREGFFPSNHYGEDTDFYLIFVHRNFHGGIGSRYHLSYHPVGTLNTWWCHQMQIFSALLAILRGNPSVTGRFPSQSQWRGALMFSLMCVWTNVWENSRDAFDLRSHGTHCDVTVTNRGVSAKDRLSKYRFSYYKEKTTFECHSSTPSWPSFAEYVI